MQEWFKLVFTKFTEETIIIAGFAVILLGVILIAFWLYNRRKFHRLAHQIPASVVKNYLDSIIQNSTALKSSLFRGGGLDVGEGVPSVVPVKDLGAAPVSSGPSYEELNQKNAEISSLQSRLAEKERIVGDLERKASDLERQLSGSAGGDEIIKLQKEIEDLKAKLAAAEAAANAGGGGGDTSDLERQLAEITKERDQLKERLMEYEIIEEDLANLKRLQQENEQLKKSLAALQGGAAAPPAEEAPPAAEPASEPEAAAEPAPEPEVAPEPEPAPEPEAAAPAEPAPEPDVPENAGPQKTAEELLGEFEKMLG